MAGNLIGEPFEEYVHKQIKTRQEIYGKSVNRSPDEISYLNSRNCWVKFASGVSLDEERLKLLKDNPLKDDIQLFSSGLGKSIPQAYVLFNGIGEFGARAGVSGVTTPHHADVLYPAYGFGGLDQGFSPMPGILDVDVKDLNRGSIKKATIKIKAHNKNQFDIIDVLYLRLGYSVMLEWGDGKYFKKINNVNKLHSSNSSLVDRIFFDDNYDNSNYTKILPQIEKERKKTEGNYDALFGTISNFSWTFNDDGSYDITIEMISLGDVIESLKVNLPSTIKTTITPGQLAEINALKTNFGESEVTSKTSLFLLYKNFGLEKAVDEFYDSAINGNNDRFYYNLIGHGNDIKFFDGIGYEEVIDYSAKDFSELIPMGMYDKNLRGTQIKQNIYDAAIGLIDNSQLPIDHELFDALYQNLSDYFTKSIFFSIVLNSNGYVNLEDDLGYEGSMYRYFNPADIEVDEELNPNGFEINNKENFTIDSISGLAKKTVQSVSGSLPSTSLIAILNDKKVRIKYPNNDLNNNPFGYFTGWTAHVDKDEAVINTFLAFQEGVQEEKDGDGNITTKGIKKLTQLQMNQMLFLNITKDDFKTGIFEYFKLVNAAGGGEDRTFKEVVYDSPEEELMAEQSKNSIYKWFFDMNQHGVKYKSSAKIRVFGITGGQTGLKIGQIVTPIKGQYLEEWNRDVKWPIYKDTDNYRSFLELDIPPPYNNFIRLGTLLGFLKKKVIPIVDSKGTKPPLIKIDIHQAKNICYTIDNVISTDIRKLIVKNYNFFNGESYSRIFSHLEYFHQTLDGLKWGRMMNIYFNCERIRSILDEVDEDGKVPLFKFLKIICTDINESLGYINNIEPVIDKETNTIRLIDQTAIPGIEKIGKHLGIGNFGEKESVFEIFGYNQDSNKISEYTSNFVTKAGITTEISKNYATMITIGATSQGSVPGAEATAFSKWNVGIKDRFKKEILPPTSTDGEESLEDQNSVVIKQYKDFISKKDPKSSLTKLGLNNSNEGGYYGINEDYLKINAPIVSDYYRYAQADISLNSTGSVESSVGFLPFNLKLEMDGISGIKIYNKVNVNTSFLPSNYPQTLKFLVTGVNHKLSNNNWVTSLETIATSVSKNKDNEIINTPKLLTGTSVVTTPTTTTTTNNITMTTTGNLPLKTTPTGFPFAITHYAKRSRPNGVGKARNVKEITGIFLHHTASETKADKGKSIIKIWKGGTASSHVIIDKNGHIETMIPIEYIANTQGVHLPGHGSYNNKGVSVEIMNLGWLNKTDKIDGVLHYKRSGMRKRLWVPESKVSAPYDFNLKKIKSFKNNKYFEEFTDAQLESTAKWIKECLAKIGMSWKFNKHTYKQMFPNVSMKNVTDTPVVKDGALLRTWYDFNKSEGKWVRKTSGWGVSPDAYNFKKGVYTHCSVLSEKVDVCPTKGMITMLKKHFS